MSRIAEITAHVYKDGHDFLRKPGYLSDTEIIVDLGDKSAVEAIMRAAKEDPFTIMVQALVQDRPPQDPVETRSQAVMF